MQPTSICSDVPVPCLPFFVVGQEVFAWDSEEDVVIDPFREWANTSCAKKVSSSISD
jgi:hypothetical protein